VFEITFKMPELLQPRSAERVVKNTVLAIADMARAEWIRLAQKRLKTTKQDYIQSIGEPTVTGGGTSFMATIKLTGTLANMVESGWEGGDLRDTILGSGSRSRKMSKDGHWYASVPFSHATPTASGMYGQPMPAPVYKEAKRLKTTLSGPDKNVLWGGKLRAGAGGAKKLQPWHSTDPYAGMVKREKTYSKATQTGGYKTFRTISTNPDTRKFMKGRSGGGVEVGWIHPGIDARNLLPEVVSFVDGSATS
jgi:hypothetical protein